MLQHVEEDHAVTGVEGGTEVGGEEGHGLPVVSHLVDLPVNAGLSGHGAMVFPSSMMVWGDDFIFFEELV